MGGCLGRTLRSAGLSLTFLAALPCSLAAADSPCKFSGSSGKFGAKGDSAALVKNGHVDVRTPAVYETPYRVDVGVWMDDSMARLAPDAPSVVLSYFEHTNCIFAHGSNANTHDGVHAMSLRIAGNRIRYYKQTIPKIKGEDAFWMQHVHNVWGEAIQALGKEAPMVNVLFSASKFVDIAARSRDGKVTRWEGTGGASNGVGQGQAVVRVDPGAYRNGAKPFNEDWWGLIAAHELGHSMGHGGHRAVKFDTMCCEEPVVYTNEPGRTESRKFALSEGGWRAIAKNDASRIDAYEDPFSKVKNPVTHEIWDYPQIHKFLKRNRSGGGQRDE
jgi:hypothetical protein